jgi:hypothetical protein
MAIKQLRISSEGQPEGLRRPIAKPVLARVFRSRATGRKPVRAMPVPAGSKVLAIVRVAVQTAVGAEEIASETGAYHRAQAEVPRAMRSVVLRGGVPAVRHVLAVRAALPAWGLVVAVGLAVAVAAGGGGRQVMKKELQMNSRKFNSFVRNTAGRLSIIAIPCALALLCSLPLLSQQKPSQSSSQSQKTFASSKDAAEALIQAAGSFDVPALTQILGPSGEDLVASEDSVRDKEFAAAFAAKAHDKNSIVVDPKNADRVILIVGSGDWPLPIPIIKRNGRWFFDTKAGRQEILYRRIGSNELDAIEICRGYVDAQREYALEKHDGAEANQYAQRIISTPGKQDGLVWRNPDGSLAGPVAEGIADALAQGYTDKAKPYHGYFFKILKGQGSAQPLGKLDFVVEGAMIGGFALAAAPAEYRVTGVKTFVVSYEGVVYQKDLGPDTLKIFKEMALYNPDKSWKPTDDNWPTDAFDTSASIGKE